MFFLIPMLASMMGAGTLGTAAAGALAGYLGGKDSGLSSSDAMKSGIFGALGGGALGSLAGQAASLGAAGSTAPTGIASLWGSAGAPSSLGMAGTTAFEQAAPMAFEQATAQAPSLFGAGAMPATAQATQAAQAAPQSFLGGAMNNASNIAKGLENPDFFKNMGMMRPLALAQGYTGMEDLVTANNQRKEQDAYRKRARGRYNVPNPYGPSVLRAGGGPIDKPEMKDYLIPSLIDPSVLGGALDPNTWNSMGDRGLLPAFGIAGLMAQKKYDKHGGSKENPVFEDGGQVQTPEYSKGVRNAQIDRAVLSDNPSQPATVKRPSAPTTDYGSKFERPRDKSNYKADQAEAAKRLRSKPANYAKGGIATFPNTTMTGKYLRGKTDGQADQIPAVINGVQPARLSDGEYVIPADVVAMLGGGNNEAGASALEQMLSRVRAAATGNKKQMKPVNHNKVLPA